MSDEAIPEDADFCARSVTPMSKGENMVEREIQRLTTEIARGYGCDRGNADAGTNYPYPFADVIQFPAPLSNQGAEE